VTKRIRLVFVGLAALAVLGCDVGRATPSPGCIDQELRAVRHLDAHDPRLIWATDLRTDMELSADVRPETGWRFDPGPPARLVERDGSTAGRDGNILASGCFDAASGRFLIGPDDLPPPDRPPN
jgi:hypothetical protein